jgi:hypothetical protein
MEVPVPPVRTIKTKSAPQIAASPERGIRLRLIVVFTVFVVAGFRLAVAVWRYSVDLVFWDQWDFYTPLFRGASWWRIFTWQHGPHREGIGLVLDKFVLQSTRWSSRAEALFMAGALFVAALVALNLKRKLFGKLNYGDIAIPCLFLTFAQMEALVGAANPSYSTIPELLIGLYCLAWLVPKPLARYVVVLLFNFLLIYTGFGFFMGAVTIGVLLLDLRRALRTKSAFVAFPAAALLIAAASLAGFFHNYVWDPAVPCFHFPDSHPLKYAWFVGLMLSYFLGLRTVVLASLGGSILAAAAFTIFIWHGVRLWRNREWSAPDLMIVILLSFTLLFEVNAAVGRVCLGLPESAQFSRYMGLLVPAFLAMYFHLLTWKKGRLRTVLVAVFAIALIPGTVRMPNGYSPQIVHDGKQAWKTCILQTGSIDYCDRATGFPVYPDPRRTGLVEKLRFLQKNGLNLYAGDR